MANIQEKVEAVISDIINDLGYTLYDIEYEKEGKDYFLRVFIDKESGIDLEDCEKVSHAIDGMLDDTDIIKEQYFLEVSSTGIEKKLTKDWHLKQNVGNQVEVKLFKPLDESKSKEYIGTLESFNDDSLVIIVNSKEIDIERKNIALIKTIYNWEGEDEKWRQ